VLHAFQDNPYLTEKIEWTGTHLALPTDVANAFTAPTFDPGMEAELEDVLAAHERGGGRLFEAPAAPGPDASTEDGGSRPLNDLS